MTTHHENTPTNNPTPHPTPGLSEAKPRVTHEDPAVDTPFDHELDALLDQTLGSDQAPPYLADRIVEATLPELHTLNSPAPVLARIGPAVRIAWRVAAVLALGAVVALAVVNAPSNTTPDNQLADNTPTPGLNEVKPRVTPEPAVDALAQLADLADAFDAAADVDQLASARTPTDAIDTELDMLAIRLELAAADRSLIDPQAVLDASVTTMQLDDAADTASLFF
ncbi:MAG: hypothetical protein AAF078_11045 [Planctomycetota bacterium]